ncbi:MAG: hypothetical protein ACKVHE_10750 [Planctomycetales bacterium]|jgi:hypothetical protein
MKFEVHELPKAKADKRHIFEWLIEHSKRGVGAWLDAYDDMLRKLETHLVKLLRMPTVNWISNKPSSRQDVDESTEFFSSSTGTTFTFCVSVDLGKLR